MVGKFQRFGLVQKRRLGFNLNSYVNLEVRLADLSWIRDGPWEMRIKKGW
jgi:hypothetical protein